MYKRYVMLHWSFFRNRSTKEMIYIIRLKRKTTFRHRYLTGFFVFITSNKTK